MLYILQLQDDQITTNDCLILLLQDDLKTSCDISEEGSPTCLSSPNLTLRKTRSGSDVGVQVSTTAAREQLSMSSSAEQLPVNKVCSTVVSVQASEVLSKAVQLSLLGIHTAVNDRVLVSSVEVCRASASD